MPWALPKNSNPTQTRCLSLQTGMDLLGVHFSLLPFDFGHLHFGTCHSTFGRLRSWWVWVRVLREKSRWQGYSCSMRHIHMASVKGKCLAFTFILLLNLGKNRAGALHWAALRAFGLWEGTGTMSSEEAQSHRQSIDSLMEPQLRCFYLRALCSVQRKKTFHSQVLTEPIYL